MAVETDNLIFLTGSTGLVGGHLMVHLHRSGKKLRALIRPTSSFDQLRLICTFYGQSFDELHDSVEWVYGDTLDYIELCSQLQGVQGVYHCAAVVSFNSGNAKELQKTNVQGTANMVDAALVCKVKRFCFISSTGAIGHAKYGDFNDENTPWKNEGKASVYTESKFHSELQVWRGHNEGLNTVIVNPGVILGPGLPNKGSLLLFKVGKKGIPFYTKATTGYVDVRDVCTVATTLMERSIFGRRFILVSGNLDNKELFTLISAEFKAKAPRIEAGKMVLILAALASEIYGKITGKTPQLTRETIRMAQRPQIYSNRQIRETLDFEFIPITQTIRDTADFLKQNQL